MQEWLYLSIKEWDVSSIEQIVDLKHILAYAVTDLRPNVEIMSEGFTWTTYSVNTLNIIL